MELFNVRGYYCRKALIGNTNRDCMRQISFMVPREKTTQLTSLIENFHCLVSKQVVWADRSRRIVFFRKRKRETLGPCSRKNIVKITCVHRSIKDLIKSVN